MYRRVSRFAGIAAVIVALGLGAGGSVRLL